VAATGDVLLHPALWDQARADSTASKNSAASTNGPASKNSAAGNNGLDFTPMLKGIRAYVSRADLAICHLETPLARPQGPFSGYPDFSGPPQIVTALKRTGYDACSTASNHTLDQGAAGISRTLDALDTAGIAHAGSARSRAEAGRITMLRPGGVQVALLSYTYGFNGHTYPGGQTWRAAKIAPARILRDARRARAQGAQVVILAMHWGTEYQQTPSAQQLALAPTLARSGVIDLIISHHAHVVAPIQRIGKVWVTYGLGNLIALHSTPGAANQEGLLAQFTFTRSARGTWSVTQAGYLPLLVTRAPPIRLLPVPQALRTQSYGSATRARLTQALTRTTRVVTSRGASGQGLVRLD
jgi:Bacterial capsule synthesis protein PGA_cap